MTNNRKLDISITPSKAPSEWSGGDGWVCVVREAIKGSSRNGKRESMLAQLIKEGCDEAELCRLVMQCVFWEVCRLSKKKAKVSPVTILDLVFDRVSQKDLLWLPPQMRLVTGKLQRLKGQPQILNQAFAPFRGELERVVDGLNRLADFISDDLPGRLKPYARKGTSNSRVALVDYVRCKTGEQHYLGPTMLVEYCVAHINKTEELGIEVELGDEVVVAKAEALRQLYRRADKSSLAKKVCERVKSCRT